MVAQPHETTWTTTPPLPTTDPEAIGRFYDAMIEPGDVGELRVIRHELRWTTDKKTGEQTSKPLIDSMYGDERQAFINAASRISGTDAFGVYLTLNPRSRSWQDDPKRHLNQTVTRAFKTTCDEDIIRRRRFLVDVDAANQKGTSATDDEHAAALALRDDIYAWLRAELGWGPARVITSSGNGAGIIFAIDLPNDEPSKMLVKRALEALEARFNDPDPAIKGGVDVANSNASRVTRIPGTVTAKGEHTAERPHRRATAVYPEGAGLVTRAQLEALAALAPAATGRAAGARRGDPCGVAGDDAGRCGADEYARLLAEGAPDGRRRTALLKLVGHYLHCGLAPAEIAVIMRGWADRCQPPVPYAHLDGVIHDLAAAEARKDTQEVDDATTPQDAPTTMSVAELRALVTTQRAELADWKAQAKAWEHLFVNRAIPDKAKRVLVHMHKRLGVTVGRAVPDTKPRALFPDAQDLHAEGLAMTAYKEGLDVLLSLDLVTRQQVMKKAPATEPGDEIGARRARARGKEWYYTYGLNGPAVTALWTQLPTLTEIAPTERQMKAEESRKERLERAVEEEKPTPQVLRALKREVAEVRQDRQKVVYEYAAAAQERDLAREQAEVAARERDRAIREAQRIVQENQRQPVMLGCTGCGQRIDLSTWRCDDCRERERAEASDSKLTSNFESPTAEHTVDVTNRLTSNFESPALAHTPMKPCAGDCGELQPHGWTCVPCRQRQDRAALHIHGSTVGAAGAGEGVWS